MEEKSISTNSNAFEYTQYCSTVGIAITSTARSSNPRAPKRFVGVDLSRQCCYVCIFNLQGKVLLYEKFSLRSNKQSKVSMKS